MTNEELLAGIKARAKHVMVDRGIVLNGTTVTMGHCVVAGMAYQIVRAELPGCDSYREVLEEIYSSLVSMGV